MSCKVQQPVCSDCVTYVKSRIKFNTFNTFNNVDVSMANVSGDIVTLDFSDVIEDNTFADGTPFGVKVEE